MLVTPTLHFHGTCKEAIALYQEAFGLKLNFLLRYSDADKLDWNEELTEEESDYVYHAEAQIGSQRIMLSDERGGKDGGKNSLFLTVTFETAEQVKKAYEHLKEGGTILYPMRSTTYSSCMVTLIDRYGFRWGLMTEQTAH